MKRILVAGATGYLGKHILNELINWGIPGVALARNPEKLADMELESIEVLQAEVTNPDSLTGIFDDVEAIISTVGITRQRDGLSYLDVDYKGNLNLLNEAKKASIKKFIYISVMHGEQLRHLKIAEAKEQFVDALKASGLAYTVVRPNGFFSDMKDFLYMAKTGRVYLFGDGELTLNPIHGADLAELCVRALFQNEKEILVGGPDILTQNEIAELALCAWGKPHKITHLPHWLRRSALILARTFTTEQTYGPIEFFLTLMARNNAAPRHGRHRLEDFFAQEVQHQLQT